MAKTTTASTLIAHLLPEALQTEESAVLHCAREAERLGAAPPGRAMREISEHARRLIPTLQRLAEARGQRAARRGKMLGRVLSNVRTFGADLLLSMEKSYRGTLHGAHHGIGTFLFLEDAAIASGDQELADFCGGWLSERKRLVEDVESELAWFAAHPEVAMTRATPPIVAKIRPHRQTAASAP
jgi:hypothetical protein